MSMSDLREDLKYTPLFVRLRDEEVDAILNIARQEEYTAGETIMNEGSAGDALYFILEGEVDVIKKGKRNTVKLGTLKKHDCFGEMSLLDVEPRSASAVSVQGSMVLRFDVEDLSTVFYENFNILPLLVTNIARILSRRLRDADRQIVGFREEAG